MYFYLHKIRFEIKILILDTYNTDNPPLGEQRSEGPWLFFESKRGPLANTALDHTSRGEIRIGDIKDKRLMTIKKKTLLSERRSKTKNTRMLKMVPLEGSTLSQTGRMFVNCNVTLDLTWFSKRRISVKLIWMEE